MVSLPVLFSGSIANVHDLKRYLAPYDFKKDIPINHLSGSHLYVREAKYPKGTIIIGRVHKFDHVFYLVSGKITIWDNTGRRTVKGPLLMESLAGTQRIGYAHTEVVCINMHGCKEAIAPDPCQAEEYFTTEDVIESTCIAHYEQQELELFNEEQNGKITHHLSIHPDSK